MLTLADFFVAHGDSGSLVNLLIEFVVLVIVFSLLYWIISVLPIPEPAKKFVNIVFVVVAALVCIYFLLGLVGKN